MQPRGGARYGHTLEVRFDGDRAALQRALDAAAERLVADARCRGLGFVARPTFAPAEDDQVELAAAHGPLNRSTLVQGPADLETGLPTFARRRPQMGGFRVDPDYPTVLALEDVDEHSGVAGKAAIFTRRVNRPHQRPDHAAMPAGAVALCLDELGRLNLPTIARLLGIGAPEAPAALGGLAY